MKACGRECPALAPVGGSRVFVKPYFVKSCLVKPCLVKSCLDESCLDKSCLDNAAPAAGGGMARMRRWLLTALAWSASALVSSAHAAESLTVASWGGSYARASKLAVLDPFSAETGIGIRLDDYNGGLAEVRTQATTGNVHWDVVDFDTVDLLRGCDEGLVELVDVDTLPPAADGTPAADDYPPGMITDCGGTTLFFSTIVAYNRKSFEGEVPTSLQDYFDLDKFPGRRGMKRIAHNNLEFALMADGVPRQQVYATLDTPEGLQRAFRKLDTIKDVIVWWQTGAQPPQLLADQEVAMTTAPNGRIFNAQALEGQPFAIVWDGQMLNSGGFGIVSGSKHLAAARQLVHYSLRPDVMARLSAYIAYGPARLSSRPAPVHLATGTPMAPHLPTSAQNRETALIFDYEWWADHGDEVSERFAAWLAH